MFTDRKLLVEILSIGFPYVMAEQLADEVLEEAQACDDRESAAFALAGLHLKAAGDVPALRLKVAA